MRNKHRVERGKDFLRSLCFLCPSLLGVCIFFVVPFGVVIHYALTDSSAADAAFVGLDNFRKLMTNAAFRLAARNTLTFSALAVPLNFFLDKSSKFHKKFERTYSFFSRKFIFIFNGRKRTSKI